MRQELETEWVQIGVEQYWQIPYVDIDTVEYDDGFSEDEAFFLEE